MANVKFRWTEHLIDCDRKYDRYVKYIKQGDNKELYLSSLKLAADGAKREDLAGYACYLLYDLYQEGEYVAQDAELAMKYLQAGCDLGETECLIARAARDSTDGEDLDKKLEQITNDGVNREYMVWEMRAYIRSRQSKKYMPSGSTPAKPNYFLQVKYLMKAKATLPKHKYFDPIRNDYKKRIKKLVLPPVIIMILALLISVFISVIS